MKASIPFLLLFSVLATGYAGELNPVPFQRNEAPFSETGPLFQKVEAAVTGIDFVNPIDTEHPDDRLYYSAMACGNVAAGDFDGDGKVDLFFANGAVGNRLYRQTGTMKFADVTADAGVGDADSWSTGGAVADVDGDGDLDIYVCCYDSPNRLFLNESEPGKPRFVERAVDFGLDLRDAGLMPNFADYDGDGDLDVFIAVSSYYRKGGRPASGVPMQKQNGKLVVLPPWDRFFGVSRIDPEGGDPKYNEIGRPNFLFRNDGGKRFTDVSAAAGILHKPSHTNSAAWLDFDEDGDLDLYVGNDFSDRDEFYRNDGGGRFTEMAATIFQHTTWFSMGSAAEDFNNDGMTDLIVADMLPTTHFRQKVTMGEMGASFESMFEEGRPVQQMKNSFFVNTGTGLFFEMAHQSGVARSDWTWTVKSGDFDGDGLVDLFLPTGHTRDFNNSDLGPVTPAMRVGKNYWDFYEDIPELREPNVAFRNRDGLNFEPAGKLWGLSDAKTMSYSSALADLDLDGDLDLVVHQLEDSPTVYRNTAAERGGLNFLQLKVPMGTRAIVTLKDGQKLTRQLLPQNGYLESDEPVLHFGLGDAEVITDLEVINPSGGRSHFTDLKANLRFELLDFELATEPAKGKPEIPAPLFRPSGSLLSMNFSEKPFDDFAGQPLLPHKHSQLGPQQAWGDVDGDGKQDLVLSGSAGKPTWLLLNRGIDEKGNPIFSLRNRPPFTDDARFEDLGVTLFDADGDRDLDLFVVSGSVEDDSALTDRLYVNDGAGNFSNAPKNSLPALKNSGSVARAADFDQDGNLDLFVGGRIVPGRYPLSAESVLLRNDGDLKFQNVTAEAAPEIAKSGLVTDSAWADVDGDGWVDLLVTHEWGPVKFFRNRNGKLEDETQGAGLATRTGWWNCIVSGDFDQDGDIDFVAGNFGRNTKYHPTMEKPEVLFFGDFDGSGNSNLIEAKSGADGRFLPRRGFSCSRNAMPFLDGKMKSYTNFAKSTLGEIYDPVLLESAKRFEATTFESGIFVNDGKGNFSFSPLPDLAQIAPVFGIAATDFDGDGWSDLVLAQNFYTPQKETGQMDGGLSLFLKGNPKAGNPAEWFSPKWPRESGIVVPGDAKSAGFGDIDGDGNPDVLIGVNNGPPRLFLNRSGK